MGYKWGLILKAKLLLGPTFYVYAKFLLERLTPGGKVQEWHV